MMDQPGIAKHDARQKGYVFPCGICGVLFPSKRCTATYCSPKCRKAASRRDQKMVAAYEAMLVEVVAARLNKFPGRQKNAKPKN